MAMGDSLKQTDKLAALAALLVTEADRNMARDAIVTGYDHCKGRRERLVCTRCDCRSEQIDGCKALIEAVAATISAARRGP